MFAAPLSLVLATTMATAWGSPAGGPVVYERELDWRGVADETATLLSHYLQSDDTNPPGRETRGALFLAAWFAELGLPSTIYEFEPGRGSLVVRLPSAAPTEAPSRAACSLAWT